MAVSGKQKIIGLVTFATEPEMFDLDIRANAMSCTNDPAITQVTQLFTACGI